MHNGSLFFAIIALCFNAGLLGAVIYFFSKRGDGTSPAHESVKLLEVGWSLVKRRWLDLQAGQKKFIFLASMFSGGFVLAAIVLGISAANWLTEYFAGIRAEEVLPFGLSLMNWWAIQVVFNALFFGYLEVSRRRN
jgi:hypothetical protein